VFAVRLDTLRNSSERSAFYIGTNDPDELTDLRRHILRDFDVWPVSENTWGVVFRPSSGTVNARILCE